MATVKEIQLLPEIKPEVQIKFQKEIEAYREKVEEAKRQKKQLPSRPSRPDGWISRTEGEALVYKKVNELINKVNELINVINKE